MDDQAMTGMGHNNPPPYDPEVVANLEARVRELADAGGEWLGLEKIETEGQAEKANDFIKQARDASKEVEDARTKAKKPHLEAGKAVDEKFKSLTAPLDTLVAKLKKPLAAFAAEKQRQLDEERRRKQEEARKAEEEAERLRREAEARNDVIGMAEAEAAEKAAAKASKAAAKPARANIASATGGGRTMAMRTTYRAEVENLNKAFSFFRDHEYFGPKLRETLERMAEAERRAQDGAKSIPGIVFHEERTVA